PHDIDAYSTTVFVEHNLELKPDKSQTKYTRIRSCYHRIRTVANAAIVMFVGFWGFWFIYRKLGLLHISDISPVHTRSGLHLARQTYIALGNVLFGVWRLEARTE